MLLAVSARRILGGLGVLGALGVAALSALAAGAAGAACAASSEDCPFPADGAECPLGCSAVDAFEIDRARACQFEIVGCVPRGSTRTTDIACRVRIADGRVVITSGSDLRNPEWRDCVAEDGLPKKRTFCEDLDGGK